MCRPVPFWPKLEVNYDETVRKNPTRPPVSWPVHVWEKGPGYGEDAKNLAIQCGWEEVGGRASPSDDSPGDPGFGAKTCRSRVAFCIETLP